MQVTINGQARELPEGATVADAIRALGLDEAVCAAEVNAQLVPRRERAGFGLSEHDVVEIVTLVGGG